MSENHAPLLEAQRIEADTFADETRPASRLAGVVQTSGFWVTAFLLVMVAVFGLATPNHAFLRADNLFTVGLNASTIMLLALGMTFLLGAGQLDLSIGANLVLASVVGARVVTTVGGSPAQISLGEYPELAPALALGALAAVSSGTLFGLVNGLLVARLRINSFIVTLGTLGIGTGIALVITGGNNIPYLPRVIQSEFGVKELYGIVPAPLVVVLVIAVTLWYVLSRTRFGLHTLAIGSSREASVRAGIDANKHAVALFVLMGVLCGLAAILDVSRFGTTNIAGHQTDNLQTIAAVVIGGTSLFGGVASVGGSLAGSLVPVVLGTGLVIMRTGPFYQLILVGVLLMAAVVIDERRRQRM